MKRNSNGRFTAINLERGSSGPDSEETVRFSFPPLAMQRFLPVVCKRGTAGHHGQSCQAGQSAGIFRNSDPVGILIGQSA
jgi:hypothetical protein